MNSLYKISLILFLSAFTFSCVDDELVKDATSSKEDFNIDSFSEGYSVAFDINLDRMGGATYTRAEDITDLEIEEWESHLDPQEFRVLFFDSKDRYLFESRSRWFTQVESGNGGGKWRVGIPIFQYLSDNYDPNISEREDYWMDDSYNWERIIEIMKSEPFKIAIMANRPSVLSIPKISDWAGAIQVKTFGKNGPFWGPKNSVASYTDPDHVEKGIIKKVFDLHHCQYDPIYQSKSDPNKNSPYYYDFLWESSQEEMPDGSLSEPLPHMGAVSSWLSSKRCRANKDPYGGEGIYYFYRLPKDKIQSVLSANGENGYREYSYKEENGKDVYAAYANEKMDDQYIPMYGIQRFAPLTTWEKGTTYNLSQQTGSQTGEYVYKGISLLRSVVKLELRIPMYEEVNGRLYYVDVNNKWAQILGNNFMARCEPMDNWSPTDSIWSDNHDTDCEWLRIREYGLYADDSSTNSKTKLGWIHGAWKEQGWQYKDKDGLPIPIPNENTNPKYPRIFNPITQRLTCSLITDCYLPIVPDFEGYDENGDRIPSESTRNYHRWIVYCGERNMNDPNTLSSLSSQGVVNYFRIEVTRNNPVLSSKKIYNLPLTDYSNSNNPINKKNGNDFEYIYENGDILTLAYNSKLFESKNQENTYNYDLKHLYQKATQIPNYKELYPYPQLRNHHYRLTLGFKDGDDINVMVENGEQRSIGDILFK